VDVIEESKDIDVVILKLKKVKELMKEVQVIKALANASEDEMRWVHHCIQQVYSGTNDLLNFTILLKEKK